MKITTIMGLVSALCLGAFCAQAQETNQLNLLNEQLQQTRQLFEKQQQEMRESFEKLLREQQAQIDALKKQVATNTPAVAAQQAVGAPAPSRDPSAPWSPSQPITVGRAGSSYMNISFDTMVNAGWSTAPNPSAQLQLGDHDPIKRGFSMRNAELSLDGAVDPYFKGFGNILFKLDQNNETELELEEAYLLSTSLPANLQLKAGQFFAGFGRHNQQHPHAWSFVDAPIIQTRAFGPDGLRSVGAQVSWLLPTPFYTEAFLGVLDGQGGTSFNFRNVGDPDATGTPRFRGRATIDRGMSGLQDLVYVPRIVSSFDLTDHQTLVVGMSGAFGPNDTGPSSRTEVYGMDAYWKWKPANAERGFPFVSLQGEALYSRFGAESDATAAPLPLPSENLRDWGFYSQVQWGFKPRWVAGLRGEYANGSTGLDDPNDPFRGERTRISPSLTFYPSEFSKIRLQYNNDHGASFGRQHSIWLQVEFLLGAHGAHKF